MLAAGLFQATSPFFPIAATAIGLDLRMISVATAAGLVAAGLISTLLFPRLALGPLAGPEHRPAGDRTTAAPEASAGGERAAGGDRLPPERGGPHPLVCPG